jgi:hypothetical protein
LTKHGPANKIGLGGPRLKRFDLVLELGVGAPQRAEEIVPPRDDLVFAFAPTLRAQLENLAKFCKKE